MLRYWNGTSWTDHRQSAPATLSTASAAPAKPSVSAVPDADPMAEYERQFETSTDTRSMIDQLSFVLDQRQFDLSSASVGPRHDRATSFASTPEEQLAPTLPALSSGALAPILTASAPDLPSPTGTAAPDLQRKRVLAAVRGIWIGGAVVVIGAVAMVLVSANIFAASGEAKASGIVTSLGATANNSCAPIARFAVTGRSYTADAAAVSPCPVGLGQTVDIFYSAADPAADAHIVIDQGVTQYLWAVPLLGAILFVVSIGMFIVRAGSLATGIALIRDGNKRAKRPVA
jgi:hypothetical protein